MKKVLILLAAVGLSMSLSAQLTVTIHQNSSKNSDTINLKRTVDLGLPSGAQWATMNVGATSPEDYGDYFAWGETTPKSIYNWSTYKYCNGSSTTLTKYCSKKGYGTLDNKDTLELADDAAHVNWGNNWRMPTQDEWIELWDNCTGVWTKRNGINGCKLTATNGNSIFLPAGGAYSDSTPPSPLNDGCYWASTICYSFYEYEPNEAQGQLFEEFVHWQTHQFTRCYGFSVRPICQNETCYTVNVYSDSCSTPQTILAPEGTQLSLTAVPENKFCHFTQWSDGNTDNPRIVTISQDTTYTAQFTSEYHTLSVTTIGCQVATKLIAPDGEQVIITASADKDFYFTQWSDGNTDNPRTVTVSQDITYTAQFAHNPSAITTRANYAERGVTTGDTTVSYGDTVIISATPNYGYHFTRWSDGNTDNPRMVVADANKQYTAIFDKNIYHIQKLAENGSVSGRDSALYLARVTLTAKADNGYYFTQWSDGNESNPRSFVLTQDTLFEAQFGTKMCRLTLQSNITEAASLTGAGIYAYGTSVTCSYDLMSGYEFIKWNDGSTYNPYSFKIYNDMTLTAFFQEENSAPGPSTTIVTPADDNANIQWPQVDNAYTYTLVIRSGGEVVCTLTFNAIGQLVNIDFGGAPSCAEQNLQTIGFNFTITGLQPGTTYDYELTAKDEQGQQVKTETGTFTTTGGTALDEAATATVATKFFRDGKLFILRNGIIYDAAGQVVK